MSVQRILSWQINSNNQERQEVIRSIDGAPATVVATLSATDTEYIDTEDYPMTTGVAYQIASVATIKGVESRAVSETIELTADGKVIKFTPYTFKSAGTTLSADSLEAFTITTNGTEYPSVFDEATSKWKLTDVVVTTTDDISITSVATPNQYSSVINITTPISEIVNWSSFDWGANGVLVKPKLTQLIKAPTVAPTTTNLGSLFYNAELFNDPSVSGWDTANVVNFSSVFAGCKNFNQPVTGWNTSNGTNLRGMFDRCFVFNQPVNHFVTSNCTDFGYMFNACMVFNQDLSNFDTSKATKMDGMFRLAKVFNYPLNHFVTTDVTTFDTMFASAFDFNQPLDTWNTGKVTNMDSMFSNTNKFNQDISSWNVKGVTNMNSMFYYAKAFTGNLSQWCVTNITSTPANFATSAAAFTKPVWGTCPVRTEDDEVSSNEMYFTTTAGTVDYGGEVGDQIIFSDGNIVTLDEFYLGNIALPSGKHKLVLAETRSRGSVSLGGEALVEIHNFPTLGSVNTFDTNPHATSPNLVKVPTTLPPNITNISFMFYGATAFNQDISMWDTSKVTNMSSMFSNCTNFNQDISSWDVSNVTDMCYMFDRCTNFNQPIGNWDVSKVTNMNAMFRRTTAFDQDISNWNVSNVEDLEWLFYNASAFNQDLSNWCVSKFTESPDGFDTNANNWSLPRPVWGTCPRGENAQP